MSRREVINPGVSPAARAVVLVIVLVVVAFLVLQSAFHVVPPGNRGVAITLGKVSPVFLGEGLNFKMPLLTKVQNIEIRQKTVQGTAEVFSSDLQNIQITYNVLYRIPEAKVVELFQQFAGEPYGTLVEPRVQEIVKQTTAAYRAEELAMNRDKLKVEVVEGLRKALSDLVFINDVTITNMQLSQQLEQAIEQKVISEQQALAKRFELDKANKDAEITIVKAKADAESMQIKGKALIASPEVVSYEIATKWDGKTPSTVDRKSVV